MLGFPHLWQCLQEGTHLPSGKNGDLPIKNVDLMGFNGIY